MGLLSDTSNCGLRIHRECRERFPRHRLQRKPLVSDPGIHHGTCVTHVPWCMSGSLTRGDGENVLGIPGACATINFTYLVRGPLYSTRGQTDTANGEINTPYLGLYCIVIILSVLELMLLVYPHIPQGLYSLSGKMPYSQISWSLEAARLDVLMTVSLWTGISAGLVSRCLSNFRAEQPKPESRGFGTSRDLEEPTMTEIAIGHDSITVGSIRIWDFIYLFCCEQACYGFDFWGWHSFIIK